MALYLTIYNQNTSGCVAHSVFVVGNEIRLGGSGTTSVLTERGLSVGLGSLEKGVLSGLDVLSLALPGLED